MAERKQVIIDGQIATDLEPAINGMLRRRRIVASDQIVAPEPERYSDATMTADETAEWLAEQALVALRRVAAGEFDIDRLPQLHEFTAEWAGQHLQDPTVAPWLVLAGPPGCGKTSQSLAVLRYLALARARRREHFDWRFVTHRNFAAMVQRGSDLDADEVLKVYAELEGVLVFSDLGDFNPQDFGRAADYTSRLINHRYHFGLPTIYETNLLYRRDAEIEALERKMGAQVATLDQVLDERVIERLMAGWTAPLPEINYRRTRGRIMGA